MWAADPLEVGGVHTRRAAAAQGTGRVRRGRTGIAGEGVRVAGSAPRAAERAANKVDRAARRAAKAGLAGLAALGVAGRLGESTAQIQ